MAFYSNGETEEALAFIQRATDVAQQVRQPVYIVLRHGKLVVMRKPGWSAIIVETVRPTINSRNTSAKPIDTQ